MLTFPSNRSSGPVAPWNLGLCSVDLISNPSVAVWMRVDSFYLNAYLPVTHSLQLIDEYALVVFGLFIMSCFSGNLSVQLECVTAHKFQQRNASSCSDAGWEIASYQPQRRLALERIWHIGYALRANSLNSCPLLVELWGLLDYNTQLCLCVLRIWPLLFILFMVLCKVSGNQSSSQMEVFRVWLAVVSN